jgi:hypothetical protein
MSNTWPPAGTVPSGLPSYCDIRNPDANKAGCILGGGTSTSTMLCSIINPHTSISQCNDSLQTSQAAQTWASQHIGVVIFLGIIGILIVLLIIWASFTMSSMVGGSNKFNSIFKRSFKK